MVMVLFVRLEMIGAENLFKSLQYRCFESYEHGIKKFLFILISFQMTVFSECNCDSSTFSLSAI